MARREARDDARIRVVQVAAGEAHTLALTAAGGVFTWGRGLFGRLGVGALQDELIPTSVAVGTNDDDDSAWSCHSGSSHSSGRDDSSRGQYVREKDGGSSRCKVTQVAAGAYHNLALTADGTVWSWGYNAYGQLGRGKTASQPSHVVFTSRSPAEEFRRGGAMWGATTTDGERAQPKMILVDAGGMISCAVDVDGALWLWGAVPNPSEYPDSYSRNSFSVVNIERPERVRGLLGLRVYRVACGNEHILALVEGRDDTDLDCYAWGNNQFGQLGLGDFRDRPCPQVVKALAASAVGSIVDLACGAFHTAILAVKDYHPTDLVLEPSSSPKGRRVKGWDVIQDSPAPTPKHSFFRTHQPIVDQLESLRNNNSPKPRMRQDSETSSSLKSTALGSSRMSSSRSLGGGQQPSRSDGRFSLEGRLSVCWTFGQGENGQLGHGTNANQAHPGPVEGLPNERLRTVACGLFHTAVVTETGDVWVWGMEGGLGLCPGIGPPGARSGDALAPVRVFGESSGNCHPVTGSKGITCGAAHTVTMSNGGKDLWAWGRGQSGVLGLGHTSDSWFPCPVVWPPVSLGPWSGGSAKGGGPDPLYPMGFDCRRSTRSVSGTNSRDRADSVKSSPKADSGMMENRRFEQFDQSAEHPLVLEEAEVIKKELAGVRRYGASLHAAVYGEVEVFSQQLPGGESLYSDRSSDDGNSTHRKHESNGDVIHQKKKPLQEWERRMETASDADLTSLDHYYRSMRVRLKEVLFQRKMDEWCRRCMSAINSSGVALEPPPRREMYSTASSPSMDGSGDWAAVNKSGLFGDKGEMLPPAAAEFRMLAGRQR